MWRISSSRNSFTTESESALGAVSKYRAQKMPACIRKVKLPGSSCIAFHLEIYTPYTQGSLHDRILNSTGLDCMLISHAESFLPHPFKSIADGGIPISGCGLDLIDRIPSHRFIAQIDPAIELRKIQVDPVGIVRVAIKQGTVFHHLSIHGILKTVGIPWLIERLVGPFRKINLIIAALPGCERTIAGKQDGQTEKQTG
jgi:hypothetical protein